MINFDEFEMANEGATTHVMPIFAEVPQDIDDTDLQANSSLELAILPLRNVVLFPGMTMPVSIGRDKSMRLIKEATSKSPLVWCVRLTAKPTIQDKMTYSKWALWHPSLRCCSCLTEAQM